MLLHLMLALALLPQDKTLHTVQVQATPARWANRAPLEVFRVHGLLTEKVAATELDKYGKGSVDLEAGNYVFEVMHQPEDSLMVVLRSAKTKVDSNETIRLIAGSPHRLQISLEGRSIGTLTDFAIRSIGPEAALHWSSTEEVPAKAPLIVCSPDLHLFARIRARNGSKHLAVWKQLPLASPWRVTLRRDDLLACRFSWISATPKGRSSWVEFAFPDSRLRIEQPEQALFLTNRRFLYVSYGFATKRGKALEFLPRAYDLPVPPDEFHFQLGGSLMAHSSARVLKRKVKNRPETSSLVWTADLTDQQGHNLNQGASDIRWSASIRFADGKPLPAGPLEEKLLKKLKTPEAVLEINLAYSITKKVRHTLRPSGWSVFEFGHFKTLAPPNWGPRVACYLSKMERVHEILGDIQGARSAETIELHWITNMSGWGRKSYMMMPFKGLREEATDWFKHSIHMTHECLHATDHSHGEELDRRQEEGEKRFSQLRWRAFDRPLALPR